MSYYMPELFAFFEELSHNNCKEWLDQNRDRYRRLRDLWLADVDRLIESASQWEPALKGTTAREAAYRFNRDIRFSPDKSPYKLFFSAAFGPYGKKSEHAGYYIDTGLPALYDSGLYAGIWCPSAPVLRKLRHAIVDNIEEFEAILSDRKLEKLFPGWIGERLKTIPKGWERNHPQAELLKLKEYGKYMTCPPEWFDNPDWPLKASEAMSVTKPLVDFLNYSIDE